MANVHTLKKTDEEVVLKIYSTESNGQTIQVELDSDDILLTNETYDANTSKVTLKELFWGCKQNKHIDFSRVDDPVANTVHGHYYLMNSGSYDFVGFVDNVYSDGAIRVVSDGAFHMILKLSKTGFPKS
jgi:hypothetical protein